MTDIRRGLLIGAAIEWQGGTRNRTPIVGTSSLAPSLAVEFPLVLQQGGRTA
jgi:hypothetical protein